MTKQKEKWFGIGSWDRAILRSVMIVFLVTLIIFGFGFPVLVKQARPGPAVKIIDTDGVPQGIHVWPGGFMGVIPSDQMTPPFDFIFAQVTGTDMTLAAAPTVNGYTALLSAGHSIIAGDFISFVDLPGAKEVHRYYSGNVVSINTNTITLDTPIPYSFLPASTYVYERNNSMVVNGSVTTQVFSLTNPYPDAVDITRIIISIRDNSPMDDALFGGIPALTRGVVLRKKLDATGTEYQNYWNIKTNGGIALRSGNLQYSTKAPSGYYGLNAVFPFSGMENHGVAIRIDTGQSIEILIQDDLTGLSEFRVLAQGHFTTVEYD